MRTTKTTKLLALVLSLLMLFTMIPLSVSAEGETKTILDVATPDGKGNYYLTGNVTETVTATVNDTFTGVFNGNGFTVKTSVPLFKSVNNATIENFTVTAEKTINERAAVVKYVYGNATFRNITNVANVNAGNLYLNIDFTTVSHNETAVGGIVACIVGNSTDAACDVLFENCTNKGSVATDNSASYESAGGILGATLNDGNYATKSQAVSIKFINCTNSATVNSLQNAGGIIGQAKGCAEVVFENCINQNKVETTASWGGVGGILGLAQSNGNVIFENCINKGEIYGTTCSGGILSREKSGTTVSFNNCINEGYVHTSTSTTVFAGGIVSYVESATATIRRCLNKGKIESGEFGAGIVASTGNTVVIESCGNEENVTSTWTAAGIHANNNLKNKTAAAVKIYYCYNIAEIVGTKKEAAGISSRFTEEGSVVIGCYNSGTITAKTHRCSLVLSDNINANNSKNNFYKAQDGVNAHSTGWSTETKEGATDFDAATLSTGSLALAMNTAIEKNVYYQNINTNGAAPDTHPVTDPTHGYVFGYNGTLYSLAFYTLQSASVRISANANERGLRFSTAVNKKDFDLLPDAVKESMDFGTLITPNDYLVDADNDFGGLEDGKYLDVNSTATGSDNFLTLKGEDNDTYYYFCGSITGIKATNYDWDYSAIGYITINGTTVCSGQYATRNIQYVATAAYNDRQAAANDTYKYEIAAESEYAIDGVASYSPYSTAELQRVKVYL